MTKRVPCTCLGRIGAREGPVMDLVLAPVPGAAAGRRVA